MDKFRAYLLFLFIFVTIASSFAFIPGTAYSTSQNGEDDAVFQFVGDDGIDWPTDYTLKCYYNLKLGCYLESDLFGFQTYSINWVDFKINLYYRIGPPWLELWCKEFPPISEYYMMTFDSDDFDLASAVSWLEFAAQGTPINTLPTDFYLVKMYLAHNKVFTTTLGTQIAFEVGKDLVFGTADLPNYPEAGQTFNGYLTLPCPYYTCHGKKSDAIPGILYLQGTPAVIRFLDAEVPDREVIGAAADGESQVIIEVSRAQTKPVVTIPEGGGKLLSDFKPVDINTWDAIWQAPETLADTDEFHRIDFEFTVDKKTIAGPYFAAFKTPVLLLHGLWSSGSVWGPMVGELEKNNFAFHLAPNYPNSKSFQENESVVIKGIRNLIGVVKKQGFVVNKVDIVSHSMGGVLTKRPVYHSANDIRRIVTVGTPHYGSGLADLLWNTYSLPFEKLKLALNSWVKSLVEHFPGSKNPTGSPTIDGGAIRNLRVKEGIPVEGNAIHVPCLTVCGISVNKDIVPDWLQPILKIASMGGLLVPDMLHDFLFGDDASDWVVSLTSQKGGMDNINIYFPSNEIGHLLEASDPIFIAKTIEFLDSKEGLVAGGNLASQNGDVNYSIPFDKKEFSSFRTVNKRIGRNDLQVRITEPEDGAQYQPGDSVHVVVEAKDADCILILGGWAEWTVDSIPPFTLDFQVPTEALGNFEITAFGNDSLGNFDISTVKINIVTQADVAQIECWPNGPLACYAGDSIVLDVFGMFSDNVKRNITSATLGTSYSSANPAVAEVSANGVIRGLSHGETSITINNQASTQLFIYVLGPPEVVRHPDPADGASLVSPSTNLDWWGVEDATTYDLYLWKTSESKPSIPTASNLTKSFYDPPSDFESSSAYSWQVVAKNPSGQTEGPIWTFRTKGISSEETQIMVSPNPFIPSRGHTQISFFGAGLPFVKIKIYNKAGELVSSLEEKEGKTQLDWDVTSDDGKKLASGVYIWVSSNKSGKQEKGKFAIIR